MPRYLRFLRTTFSVTCLIACVLLIVLWVRSYWLIDCFDVKLYRWHVFSGSGRGRLSVGWQHPHHVYKPGVYYFPASLIDVEGNPVEFPRGFSYSPGTLFMPNWCPTLVFAALAAIPWLPWRFSLRTMLIVTTLVAVVLGLVVYALRG